MRLLEPDSGDAEKHHMGEEEVTIVATRDELMLLANSLNEALEAVEDWEFDTRLGSSVDEARALHATINEFLRNDAARQ